MVGIQPSSAGCITGSPHSLDAQIGKCGSSPPNVPSDLNARALRSHSSFIGCLWKTLPLPGCATGSPCSKRPVEMQLEMMVTIPSLLFLPNRVLRLLRCSPSQLRSCCANICHCAGYSLTHLLLFPLWKRFLYDDEDILSNSHHYSLLYQTKLMLFPGKLHL
jgi:hypothetical protein